MLAGLGFLVLVGIIDYRTGFDLSFSVFYLLGIGLGTWLIGRWYGLLISVLSVPSGLDGRLRRRRPLLQSDYSGLELAILMTFYFVVVWLLASLQSLHQGLEAAVRQRTVALTREMAERERLEEEILEVSEREQRRIGHDLHDSLCQHLTGTALAGQVLGEKLPGGQGPARGRRRGQSGRVGRGRNHLARNLAGGFIPWTWKPTV